MDMEEIKEMDDAFTKFKQYTRKPAKSRAFKFHCLRCAPQCDSLKFRENRPGNTLSVWNELHDSWINFSIGDWVVGVPGDYYPHESALFEKSHYPIGSKDAHLIAAAPELLKAASDLLERVNHLSLVPKKGRTTLGCLDAWDDLKRAIAKAEGRNDE